MIDAYKRFRKESHERAKKRWAGPIDTPLKRVGAWASLLLADHGLLRPVYWNFHEVTPDVWRGPQPNPVHIAELAKRGLKTIVNLRGPTEYGSYALAREAAERHGLAFENAVLWSRSAPRPEEVHRLDALFGRIAYPALLHCKSGADRSGLAAALYLILREGVPVDVAAKQLDIKYGHIRSAKTGVLDVFLEAYLAENARRPIGFREWLDTVYDRDTLEKAYEGHVWGDVLVDKVLRRE